MKKIVIIVIVMFLLSASGCSNRSGNLPSLEIEYNGDSIEAVIGTNEWSSFGQTVISDSDVPWKIIRFQQEIITVTTEDEIYLKFSRKPKKVTMNRVVEGDYISIPVTDDYSITIVPDGSNPVYEVKAEWRNGYIYYAFTILNSPPYEYGIIPIPLTINVFSDGDVYTLNDIEKAVKLINDNILDENIDIVELAVDVEYIELLKKEEVCLELIYNEMIVIQFESKTLFVNKILIPLSGDDAELLFWADEDEYRSGPVICFDKSGIEKLHSQFHITTPRTKK